MSRSATMIQMHFQNSASVWNCWIALVWQRALTSFGFQMMQVITFFKSSQTCCRFLTKDPSFLVPVVPFFERGIALKASRRRISLWNPVWKPRKAPLPSVNLFFMPRRRDKQSCIWTRQLNQGNVVGGFWKCALITLPNGSDEPWELDQERLWI